mmetsp:Transcript_5344/g.7893  ORF Transcript_5344/g.7893 Transcript_5344/m.7893 type:complete len:130 (+) Transcript_5344:103-492(+)
MIFAATAAFIFVRSLTAENVSGIRKLSDETQPTELFTVQSVISCDTSGIPLATLNSLNNDHDVIKTGNGFIHIRIRSADERAEVEATVGSACELLYDLQVAISSFEKELATSRQGNDWFAAYHTYEEIV